MNKFFNEIKQFKDYFENLVYCKVEDDVITVFDSVCFNDIALGKLSEEYFVDKKYKEVNILDYITNVKYFAYYQPLSYDLFNRYFNLNDKVLKVLENNQVNIYEVELIMGGLLKDMGGYKNITTEQCYPMHRINSHKIQIQTPPNLLKHEITITTNSYYPNTIFIME